MKYNIGISIDSDYLPPLENYKINTIQLMFVKNPDLNKIKNYLKKYNIKNTFIHASFRINIAENFIMNNRGFFSNSYDLLKKDIEKMKKINANNIVIHTGVNTQNRHLKNQMIDNMKNVIKKILELDINVILETSCEKYELLTDLNEFVEFVMSFKNDNLYVCIDTCHIFQAGYDIRDKKIRKDVYKIFEPIKNKIKVIHLNDSYYEFNERKDRHALIGEGHIGKENLLNFINHYKKLPIILETNFDKNTFKIFQ